MIACRVLPHESGDGPANMGLDEALLESVAADPTAAIIRTYTWTIPTLSLGYFQPIARAESERRWRDAPIVRRPTGGGALWHDREVTYAVVVPRDHPLARRSTDLYRAVHATIAGLLAEVGLDARRRGESDGPTEEGGKPFLCFLDRDAEDVVAGTAKIVGSAQRRRAGAVLQHGSVLLARSEVTPELPGAADVSGCNADPLAWGRLLREAIPRGLGLLADESPLSDDERRRAESLADEVYRDPSWTRKR